MASAVREVPVTSKTLAQTANPPSLAQCGGRLIYFEPMTLRLPRCSGFTRGEAPNRNLLVQRTVRDIPSSMKLFIRLRAQLRPRKLRQSNSFSDEEFEVSVLL